MDTPELKRVFLKLKYKEGEDREEGAILAGLSAQTRQRLDQGASTRHIPREKDTSCPWNACEKEAGLLKVYLCWCLEHRLHEKALAAIALLDSASPDVTLPASVFDDVMQVVTTALAKERVPPALLVRWGRVLQVKGDLHGAVRQLSAARQLISEIQQSDHESADMVLGECTQLEGLTLNKMCCWKSAICPMVESAVLLRRCHEKAAERGDNSASSAAATTAAVSLEMVARCLCSITHGDYLDINDSKKFVHGDRFYQAYRLCVEASALAASSSSQLLVIRTQNQAAESLLKHSAHVYQQGLDEHDCERHTNAQLLFKSLERVVQEVLRSLRSHTDAANLCRREQFFEFVRSLFLLSQALAFSVNSHLDRQFSRVLGERARVLYEEYGRQLSRKDFRPDVKIDLTDFPGDIRKLLCQTIDELGLQCLREAMPQARGQSLSAASNGSFGQVSGNNIAKLSHTASRKHVTTISINKTQPQNASSTPLMLKRSVKESPLPRQPWQLYASPVAIQQLYQGQEEVGLPIDPAANDIPIYDVPLTIFQQLCGCKFNQAERPASDSQSQLTDPKSKLYANGESEPSQNIYNSNCTDLVQSDTPDTAAHERCAIMNGSSCNGELNGKLRPGSDLVFDSWDALHREHFVPFPLETTRQDSGYYTVTLVDTFLSTKLSSQGSSLNCSSVGNGSGTAEQPSHLVSPTTQSKCTMSESVQDSSMGCVSDIRDYVRRARLIKFNPVTGLWTSQTTLVYIGKPLDLEEKLKGKCREAFHVQFLHQDEVLGRYVGKRYIKQRPPSQYLQDVTCQKTARFLVTLFNYALNDLKYDIQIVYVPVAHLQLLSRDGNTVEDWLNVEPYLDGDFTKLTNNLKFCNSQGRTLATALTHYTYDKSEGRLMLVDLQGWLPREGRGVVYLTDPQFHTRGAGTRPLSSCDLGLQGIQAFWDVVHPQCNPICQALGLTRPAVES